MRIELTEPQAQARNNPESPLRYSGSIELYCGGAILCLKFKG
jgi:hypothetical protein